MFELTKEIKFKQLVKVNTSPVTPGKRFGVEQEHIDQFIQALLSLEVDGRNFRTKYQIPMASGAPQAENFLWTILGNKVRERNCSVGYE